MAYLERKEFEVEIPEGFVAQEGETTLSYAISCLNILS